jgi:DNA-binding NtrC family response regulator
VNDEPRAADTPGVVIVFAKGTPMRLALPLVGGRLVVGRAEVRFDGAAWTLRDRGSAGGTHVGTERVTGKRPLDPSSVIRAGSTVFFACSRIEPFLAAPLPVQADADDGVIAGPMFRAALDAAVRARELGDRVLVLGESGSGKDLVARAFHSGGPFIAVHCAALPEGVAERLLFGALRGAHPGATQDADGYLQAADDGTLFLDEVDGLSLDVQTKLLRVLETHEVLPLGARPSAARIVDVRFCFATHRDLRAAVANGRFRADLHDRIARPEVRVPPLRARLEDFPSLVALALSRVPGAPPAHARLVAGCMARPWPGNVRELMAEVRGAGFAAAAAGAETVRETHLRATAGMPAGDGEDTGLRRASPMVLTAAAIAAALREHDGDVAAAARALRLHRTQLYRRMAELGLESRVTARGAAAGRSRSPRG